MSQLTFDTLKFVKTLENAGISKEHAEAITNAQKEAFGELAAAKDLATKQDILLLKNDMLAFKADMVKWFLGVTIAIVGFMAAGFGIVISLLR